MNHASGPNGVPGTYQASSTIRPNPHSSLCLTYTNFIFAFSSGTLSVALRFYRLLFRNSFMVWSFFFGERFSCFFLGFLLRKSVLHFPPYLELLFYTVTTVTYHWTMLYAVFSYSKFFLKNLYLFIGCFFTSIIFCKIFLCLPKIIPVHFRLKNSLLTAFSYLFDLSKY